MTWKDKLEIGLKDDAPFRRDNLPDFQKRHEGPDTRPEDPTRSPEEPGAREQAINANRRERPQLAEVIRRPARRPAASRRVGRRTASRSTKSRT